MSSSPARRSGLGRLAEESPRSPHRHTAAEQYVFAHRYAILVTPAGRHEAAGCPAPVASASLYEPTADPYVVVAFIRCPCGCGVHLGRVWQEADAAGLRRAGCGRVIWVKVRNVYRSCADHWAAVWTPDCWH